MVQTLAQAQNNNTKLQNCQLVGPFRQLLTFNGLPDAGPINDDQLSPIADAGILFKDGLIVAVGVYKELLYSAKLQGVEICHLEEDFVCIPGLIDAHTHICFEGSRARDYSLRNAGQSYLEIAESGGGIWDTVQKTRQSSLDQLSQSLFKRVSRHLSEGVTSIEVKSGYGLAVDQEIKMLESIKAVDEIHRADLISTCLAAHMVPRDYDGKEEAYLDHLINDLLPIVKDRNLSNRIDIFIESGAFSVDASRTYLTKAKKLGFNITIHADQFSTGGSELAVELQALSADHLEASSDREIELLAKSHVVATALPGASLGLGCQFAPARKILDAGGALAIASDWNPGSAPMGDLLCQAALIGASEKLTNAEVLAGTTYRSAKALGLSDRGKIKKGYLADFILFPGSDYREILYHQGKLKPGRVWKRGELIVPCL